MSDAAHNGFVELRSVTKQFEDTRALRSINLNIRNGEFITLLGPSGCGKTTLLRLIAGFENPTEGEIRINGESIGHLPPNKREVNTVFQSYALFPHMTVFDNVAFGLKMSRRDKANIREEVREALRMVKLEGMENRKPQQLSGGQQQRVAFARALVNKPLVLLLDEPLSALDYKLRKQMQVELKHLQRKLGITFIFVTHDQEEAFSMSDRVAVMHEGEIMQLGSPTQIYEEPENLFVAEFVGEINILDGVVLSREGKKVRARVEGAELNLTTDKDIAPGEAIKVLLRPEDLLTETVRDLMVEEELNEHFPPGRHFRGRVEETIYKGKTYDVYIILDGGKRIIVSEFFNEDAETVYFKAGDEVKVSWYEGWEAVLRDA